MRSMEYISLFDLTILTSDGLASTRCLAMPSLLALWFLNIVHMRHQQGCEDAFAPRVQLLTSNKSDNTSSFVCPTGGARRGARSPRAPEPWTRNFSKSSVTRAPALAELAELEPSANE